MFILKVTYGRGHQTENRFTDQTYFQHDAINRTSYVSSSWNDESEQICLTSYTMFINALIAVVPVVYFHASRI
jgi:hypothetical protein